jgi:anti-anti-sigma factor
LRNFQEEHPMSEQSVAIVERHPDLIVVHIQPEAIDDRNLTAIHTAVDSAGSESPQTPVAVDMTRVNFMPSMSLAGFIRLSQLFKSRKQRLVLVNLQPAVRETLVVTKLDRLFEIHPDLSALRGPPG